ncbi:MAG TPA: cell division FtsA domain-containing protein [Candidatus Paceibacterota bacterium]|mgnify:FL=1|nr:cell division FtsA domain-containing protein [Candidatus Paceibacterota bacterium]HRV32183.1 cell division FtsA domain-containing protein [Candidatus Paceibacterota bacterium]
MGVIGIDLGAGTTSFSVFEEDKMIYTKVLPAGGNYISNDIALWLTIPPNEGENIKIK